ncbi:hypothetical protein [Kribbella sp. CA-293567]|uniref:hypothetical protein n=1 Tax=Kribbella sp. CA-293567 TaxID=3002436 RepID=UPI0022DE6166|nr:hypothetical protein [Kribbella sp. CA-293567]WBQ03227.1 hypothetical protein OX958_24980 [Kribbella sp. CA-293567]
MSDVQRLKEQLHQVASEAKQASGGLAGFKLRFAQHTAQVESLIAGTSTRADRDIAEVLDAAGKAVDQAVEALQIAAAGCANYANQI